MKLTCRMSMLVACLTLISCVTVNVYFPAQAAESAAAKFTKDVYGARPGTEPAPSGNQPPADKQGALDVFSPSALFAQALDIVIPSASAQEPDLNLSTPGVNALKAAMQSRQGGLAASYQSGAVGIGADGLLAVRDPAALPLADRNRVNALVADENRDRSALYQEIAKANGHPEWESRIRDIWASQWIANAPSGYWYQDGSGWKQK